MIKRFTNWLAGFFNRYEAAQWSYGSRTWLPGQVQSAHLDISKATRAEISRKARYFEKNSELVNKLADLFELYVVGQGIQFFPASSDSVWNEAATRQWNGWKPLAAVDNLQGFDALQGVIARALFIDGEIFVWLLKGSNGSPRIQLIESHRCSTPPDLAEREGKTIFDGVQVDGNGRPTGYYIDGKLFDASVIVHIFEPARAGQYRGLSMLSSCLNTLHDLDDLQMFEMQAAKRAARTTDVITTASGELNSDMLRKMKLGAAGASTATTPAAGATEYLEQVNGAKPVVLRSGESYQQYQSNRPSVVTQEFWKKLESKVCASTGMPYILVYPESMQGTVFRGAIDSAAAFFRARYSALAVHLGRIYEFVIDNSKRYLPATPPDWRRVDSRPPKAVNVDVGRNSSAVLQEIAAGIRSHIGVIAEDGGDWRAILTQKATVQKFAIELAANPQFAGVTVENIIASGLPAPTASAPEPAPQEVIP